MPTITKVLSEMKNNTPGEDDVVVEAIKLGGEYQVIESLIEKSLEYNKPIRLHISTWTV